MRVLSEALRIAMTVFQLKQLASTSVHAAAGAIGWNYDRAELIADGIVHAHRRALRHRRRDRADRADGGLCRSPPTSSAVSIYVAGLLSMLVLSATYNLWPVSPANGCCGGSIIRRSIC